MEEKCPILLVRREVVAITEGLCGQHNLSREIQQGHDLPFQIDEPLNREKPIEFTFLLTQDLVKNGTPSKGSANQDCWEIVSSWSYPTPDPRIAEEEKYGMGLFLVL